MTSDAQGAPAGERSGITAVVTAGSVRSQRDRGACLLPTDSPPGIGTENALTARQNSETALENLRESEAFIRTVLDNLPVGLAVNALHPRVTFRYMNESFPRLYRTTREQLATPDAFWDAAYEDPEFRAAIRQRVLEDCASGDPARMVWRDVPITRRGQPTTYITARNLPVPGRPLIISMVWDVTEARQAEARLQEQLDELRRWHQATLDREGRILELKREVNELLRQAGQPARYLSVLPPDLPPQAGTRRREQNPITRPEADLETRPARSFARP
ncbi:MAG: hypothetical protein HS113_27410 [Verrucomicrobiales bacterium]|nr:hypothetical protein [Verrucomicrobiales bacterium]